LAEIILHVDRTAGCQAGTYPFCPPEIHAKRENLAPLAGWRALVTLVLSWLLQSSNAVFATEAATKEPIQPVPSETHLDARKVDLGRRLFADSRLSNGNGVSCVTCHVPDKALTDGLPISRGGPGGPGSTNTPTLYNIGLNTKFNWSGQYMTLEEQTEMVVENPRTMAGNWKEVIATLAADVDLSNAFAQAYEEGITKKNAIDAIVQYEQSLVTPDAPFDAFLKGDRGAISADAAEGYKLFKKHGCVSCHQGVNVGGNMLQVFGIFGTPDAAAMGSATPGSAQYSGIAEEKPVFRVPPLRNVAMTAPYFHDGSAKTLKDAIETMAGYQLGRSLADDDVKKLEAFLNSLTGKYQGTAIGGR